jgi:dephospho-CoA kinase
LREEEEKRLEASGARIVVHVIPLLFETGLEAMADAVVLVDAPEDVRLKRLVTTRNLSEKAARAMIDAQMPASAKRAGADIIIDNSASLAELEHRADQVLDDLRVQARARNHEE